MPRMCIAIADAVVGWGRTEDSWVVEEGFPVLLYRFGSNCMPIREEKKMNRGLTILAGLSILAFALDEVRAQDPSFHLNVDVPPGAGGLGAGPTVTVDAVCTLETQGLDEGVPGAQGWSVSVAVEGWTSVDSATIDGTAGAETDDGGLRDGGFEKTEVVAEGAGAVSAIVLAFTEPVTLPPSGVQPILALSVTGDVPAIEDGAQAYRVFYQDGLQGSGQPVDNKVTYDGETRFPTLGEGVTVVSPDCAMAELNVIFQAELIGLSETPFDGASQLIEVGTQPGTKGQADVYAALVSNYPETPEDAAVQGWSLSVAAEGLALLSATIDGTAAADVDNGGLWDGGFEKTEVIDPELPDNAGLQGAVSAIVLSFTQPIVLPKQGTATVLALTVEALETTEPDVDPPAGRLFLRDDLRGAGQPVKNVATVKGGTAEFCGLAATSVEVAFPPLSVGSYRTSDGNGDGKIDIADPIYLVNFLFREGPAFPCLEAADANGDEMVDLSDATYVIQYLFLGGPAPVGDLECHVSDASTPESCPAGATACDV